MYVVVKSEIENVMDMCFIALDMSSIASTLYYLLSSEIVCIPTTHLFSNCLIKESKENRIACNSLQVELNVFSKSVRFF